MLATAQDCFGLLGGSRETVTVIEGWAGLYPGTRDGHPVIEMSDCLVTAAGFAGTGLMHAPAAGQLVAELVVDGKCRSMDISALASARLTSPAMRSDESGF